MKGMKEKMFNELGRWNRLLFIDAVKDQPEQWTGLIFGMRSICPISHSGPTFLNSPA